MKTPEKSILGLNDSYERKMLIFLSTSYKIGRFDGQFLQFTVHEIGSDIEKFHSLKIEFLRDCVGQRRQQRKTHLTGYWERHSDRLR